MLRRCVMGVLALVLGSPLLCGGGTAASPGLVTSWHCISRPGAKVHASGLTGTPGGEETRACSSLAASGACSRAFQATAAGRGHAITDSVSRTTTGSCHSAVARSSALVPANLAHAMIRDARFQAPGPGRFPFHSTSTSHVALPYSRTCNSTRPERNDRPAPPRGDPCSDRRTSIDGPTNGSGMGAG